MEYVNDEILSEFDNENVAYNIIRVEEETLGLVKDKKEFFEFYKRYASNVNFPI